MGSQQAVQHALRLADETGLSQQGGVDRVACRQAGVQRFGRRTELAAQARRLGGRQAESNLRLPLVKLQITRHGGAGGDRAQVAVL